MAAMLGRVQLATDRACVKVVPAAASLSMFGVS
jgi:hypothetical protein